MYVITGATGNTGGRIAEALLDAGQPVRVVGRSAERLQALVDRGAQAAIGDLEDAGFVADAFAGATAVYAMVPPNFGADDFRAYQNRVSDALVEGVRKGGVRRVVTLSSVGAHLEEGAGVVQGIHDMEQKFDSLPGVDVLHLRATYFMENLFMQIGSVKQMGAFGGPLRADLRFPIVHTSDIAAVAARRLLDGGWTGSRAEYVLGAEDVDNRQVARVLGTAIGRPELDYVEIPYADFQQVLAGAGASPSVAALYTEFMRSMNEGRILEQARRSPENTTPTRLEVFAPEFAGAFSHA
ncbi:MAG TPA: NAD(P)H-binding protein [Longimicrobium sp.]|nr:NAD(P)H-binding protein [Longimicrobium sp.]